MDILKEMDEILDEGNILLSEEITKETKKRGDKMIEDFFRKLGIFPKLNKMIDSFENLYAKNNAATLEMYEYEYKLSGMIEDLEKEFRNIKDFLFGYNEDLYVAVKENREDN